MTELLHPELIAALARAGHGARVLITDGHYPASTAVGPRARTVYLNLSPGLLDASTVLDVVARAVPLDAATVMVPPAGQPEPPAIGDHRARLAPIALEEVDRWAFYDLARSDDVALAVVTADVRPYANVLATIGVRQF